MDQPVAAGFLIKIELFVFSCSPEGDGPIHPAAIVVLVVDFEPSVMISKRDHSPADFSAKTSTRSEYQCLHVHPCLACFP